MKQTHGVRIQERMAGWIRFTDSSFGPVPSDSRPFEININAFCDHITYPFNFRFKGYASLPGFPLPYECTADAATPPIEGTMRLSHKGVAYDFTLVLPQTGKIRIAGEKTYRYTLNPLTVRDSLITLPYKVYQNEKAVGEGQMLYLPPLYHFPFGVRWTSSYTAFEPRLKFSESIKDLAQVIVPNYQDQVSNEEFLQLIRQQVNHLSWWIFTAIRLSYCLVKLMSLMLFFTRLAKLNERQREKFALLLSKNRLLWVNTFPLNMLVLNAVYCSNRFLSKAGQHMPPPAKNEPQRWRELNVTPSREAGEVEVDVVVIGSGAGGAALAYELSRKGLAVAVVEEGHYFQRADMNGKRLDMLAKLYRNGGQNFTISNSLVWLPTGKCVGGTTTINSGTSMRTPDPVLMRWEKEFGLSSTEFKSYFPAVEDMLDSKLCPENLTGSISTVLRDGLKNGQAHPLTRAETGCDGQGHCVMGCPTGAKRSTDVSYMSEAMKNNAFLFSHYQVDEILIENGKAIGVKAHLENYAEMFPLIIRAQKVVLAAGTLRTPVLLKKIRDVADNLQLGKNLSIHPALNVGAMFERSVRDKLCVPQSMSIFTQGKGYCLEGYTLQPDTLPMAFHLLGKELSHMMNRCENVTNFASMISDPTYGQLVFARGSAIPQYNVGEELKQLLNDSASAIGEIFFEAGAKEVYFPIAGLERITDRNDLRKLKERYRPGYHYTLSAHHPLGTCRMGSTPYNSVINKYGEVWGLQGLYVADGSAIPGPLGANPQVTIMANALRVANHIMEQLR